MKKILSVLLAICFVFIASSCNKEENVSSQIASNEKNSSLIAGTESLSSQTDVKENSSSKITSSDNATSKDTNTVTSKTETNSSSQNSKENSTVKSILKTEINSKGELVVIYSDGTSDNLGKVTNNTSTSSHKIVTNNTSSQKINTSSYIEYTETSSKSSSSESSSSEPSEQDDISSIYYEICTVRGNDLPHKWVSATCETNEICSFCQKEFGQEAYGHNLNGSGKCTTCDKDVAELIIVECPNVITFERNEYKFSRYSYNTKNRVIRFNFTTKSNSELYVKAKFYNGTTLLSTKTLGPRRDSSNTGGSSSFYCEFESNVTKIVIEGIS